MQGSSGRRLSPPQQATLFDAPLAEVTTTEGRRYIRRCNPERAKEIASSREPKCVALNTAVVAANEYLATYPRANPDTPPPDPSRSTCVDARVT